MIISILTGKVLWSYAHELEDRNLLDDIGAHFTGTIPFHTNEGEITLTTESLILTGTNNRVIPLGTITEVFLGFDELFPRTMVKNFGLFWQPLRVTVQNTENVYLIIDFRMIGTKNQVWFDTMKEILAGS